jgi:hypothetical protein
MLVREVLVVDDDARHDRAGVSRAVVRRVHLEHDWVRRWE